jgi:hypothetical protein
MQIELILEEREKKSAVGTNGNCTKAVLINQIKEEEQDDIGGIKKAGHKDKTITQITEVTKNGNGPSKCSHFHKPGRQVEKCFTVLSTLRNQFQRANNNNPKQNNRIKKY